MFNKKIVMMVASVIVVSAIFITGFMSDSVKKVGIDLEAIDKSIKPSEDFYQYANGTWVKNNPVPGEQPRWGNFDVITEENNKKILTVVEDASRDAKATNGTNQQRLRDFYNIAMDSALVEKQGVSVIQPEIDKINQVISKDQLLGEIAYLHQNGFASLFGFYVFRDLKKSDEYICYFSQGGLGLPDRDYYLKDDEKNVKIREQYLAHISKMLQMMGRTNTDAQAKKILSLETELAKVAMSRVDLRDEQKTYNRFDFAKLTALTPSINWTLYLNAVGAGTKYPFSVGQPEFFKRLNTLIDSIPMSDWQSYLSWNLIRGSSAQLSSNFLNESFSFYGKTMNGIQVQRPRWKRALGACDDAIGEIVGQAYVEKYFSEQAKQKVHEMVANILAAYKIRIQNLDWMSSATKEKALTKLSMFNTKLAFTDKWRDYSKLDIKTDAYVLNVMRANRFDYNFMINKLGKPVDKTEWGLLPHQVNAYYEPTLNEVVFPAGIMQPPFFYPEADDAVNYGAIGSAIGHEITHGFDDQGSKYDGKGNLVDWWTDQDLKLFNERKKILIDQYSKYEALPGVFVNGELTIGENIADLGGLSIAYQAYQISLKGKPAQIIDGYTGDQRFFLAFGQVWRGNFKEEYLRKMVLTNVHSPGNFRTYTVSNLLEFYKAFDVKVGDKMFRDEATRAKIW